MSTKAVIVWLVIAVVLGAVAIWLLMSPKLGQETGKVPVGSKLLTFAAADVAKITVGRADGGKEIIERAPNAQSALGTDAEWQLRMQPAKADEYTPPPWPIAGPRMQSLLRVLADVTSVGEAAPDAKLGERPIPVTIAFNNGTERTITLAERTLAGSCLAEVSGAPAVAAAGGGGQPARAAIPPARALIDAKVHELFTNPGPRAWRDTAVMAALAGEASRVRLENPRQKLVLAKADGRWSVREPVSAPADSGAVSALLSEMSKVQIADFLDAGTANAVLGLEKPEARLAIEVDRRNIAPGASDVTVSTTTCEVAIGKPADAGRGRVFASINSDPEGPGRIVLIDAAALARVSMDAGKYIWPFPTRLAAADIGTIVLDRTDAPNAPGSKAFRRTLTRWSQIRADGSEVTLADRDLRDVDALAAFLTGGDRGAFSANSAAASSQKDQPEITIERPDSLRVIGRIVLLSLAGEPFETMEIGVTRPGQAMIRTGAVYREYQMGRLPTLLNDLLNAAPPVAPSEADKKPDINK